MKDCILEVRDEVNVKFVGLDLVTRRKISDKTKYFLPYARHTPSYKLGRWDGYTRYCDLAGRTFLNLIEELLPILKDCGYNVVLDDRRGVFEFDFKKIDKNSYSDFCWPKGHQKEGEPIVLRDHQVDIVNDLLENPHGITVAPTGAGKTISVAILSHQIEKYGRSLIIVPNKDLVNQTEEDYINLGLDVGVYFGDRKQLGKKHTIATWQSISYLLREKNDNISLLNEITDDLVCVIVDEVHKAKADEIKKILTNLCAKTPIRWGLTGTIQKEPYYKVEYYK